VNALIKLGWPATQELWEIAVLFEDAHLLALRKPPCLLTSPDRQHPERPDLMKLLHTAIAEGRSWARQRGLSYLMRAQRLDYETSGGLLLAKSRAVLVQLANLFGAGRVREDYAVLVQGAPEKDAFEVEAPLACHPTRPGLMHIDRKRGKKSKTLFQVAERFRGYALLRCQPQITRIHQIRVHLQSVGLPVVGDRLYGGGPLLLSRLKPGYRLKPGQTERPLMAAAAVHAEQIELPHPVTGQLLTVQSEWPKDFAVAVKYLRRLASGTGSSSSGSPPA
jgi:23S rRNA pseudouridine1911/1915/1917 synthase